MESNQKVRWIGWAVLAIEAAFILMWVASFFVALKYPALAASPFFFYFSLYAFYLKLHLTLFGLSLLYGILLGVKSRRWNDLLVGLLITVPIMFWFINLLVIVPVIMGLSKQY